MKAVVLGACIPPGTPAVQLQTQKQVLDAIRVRSSQVGITKQARGEGDGSVEGGTEKDGISTGDMRSVRAAEDVHINGFYFNC